MTIICNLHFSFPTCCIDCSLEADPVSGGSIENPCSHFDCHVGSNDWGTN
ncbi:hypothetical protein NC651_020712 [Populus alba x Populus x berolinensis]|nr:hypothetical protein NC651_020712 [Populus alba x Populus x berolinensis]